MDDKELISLLQKGDAAAFSLLVKKHQNRVYNTCLGIIHHPEEAEDLAQEVFIEVYKSIHKFRGDSALTTWLYKISVTKSLESIRAKKRKKRFAFLQSISKETYQLSGEDNAFNHPGVKLENKDRARVLFQAMEKLPEKQRIAFTLHKVEHLSYKEICDAMEMSLSSVESLIHRAKKNLRKHLEHYYKEIEKK